MRVKRAGILVEHHYSVRSKLDPSFYWVFAVVHSSIKSYVSLSLSYSIFAPSLR